MEHDESVSIADFRRYFRRSARSARQQGHEDGYVKYPSRSFRYAAPARISSRERRRASSDKRPTSIMGASLRSCEEFGGEVTRHALVTVYLTSIPGCVWRPKNGRVVDWRRVWHRLRDLFVAYARDAALGASRSLNAIPIPRKSNRT